MTIFNLSQSTVNLINTALGGAGANNVNSYPARVLSH